MQLKRAREFTLATIGMAVSSGAFLILFFAGPAAALPAAGCYSNKGCTYYSGGNGSPSKCNYYDNDTKCGCGGQPQSSCGAPPA